jgi:hypothetical protein
MNQIPAAYTIRYKLQILYQEPRSMYVETAEYRVPGVKLSMLEIATSTLRNPPKIEC